MAQTTRPKNNGNTLCTAASSQKPIIHGTADQEIFALSFGPGAFDTMVQLGVTHALLVSGRRPPDVVVGLSSGAATAVALGEVFAEGKDLNGRVGRFREILNAARDSLRVLRHELSPDPLELNTEYALAPMELPVHHKEERKERIEALRSISGFLRLFNDVGKLRNISLHIITQLTQCILCVRESLSFRDAHRYRSEVRRAFYRLARFILLHQWRFIFPICRAAQRILAQKNDADWKVKPLQDLLSPWQHLASLLRKTLAAFVTFTAIVLIGYLLRNHVFAGGILLVGLVLFLPVAVLVWGTYFIWRGPSTELPPPKPSKWWYLKGLSLLEAYDLHNQLFNPYVLKQFLISIFDPHYYGQFDLREAVETAVKQNDTVAYSEGDKEPQPTKTKIDKYLESSPPMHIAIVATELSTGSSSALPDNTPIIDGILASTAFPPFLKPMSINNTQYIDPSCIGEEPFAPLMNYLRPRADPATKAIHIFHVTPFPAQAPKKQEDVFSSPTTIAFRSVELLRSRHVSIEEGLSTQYSDLLPKGGAIHEMNGSSSEPIRWVSANLFPIETEIPLHVTTQFLTALSNDQREKTVLHAVATGCRITLQRILAPEAAQHAQLAPPKCRELLKKLGQKPDTFPGNDTQSGPGLHEVCDYCTLKALDQMKSADPFSEMQVLRFPEVKPGQPLWPTDDEHQTRTCSSGHSSSSDISMIPATPKPTRDRAKDQQQSWVSTLWSGGVFRGVFQIGAINGYNEAKLKPRIFAGASIGSIMAAFAARVTSLPEPESKVAIQKAAATFIGLDKLVLTDRFADLVRRLTMRANDVRITPKELDNVFRQFDQLSVARFSKSVRRVAGGFERLLYISPFELLTLIQAFHNTDGVAVKTQLFQAIDYFFERSGAGLELLGAGPLHMLITEHVLGGTFLQSRHTMTVENFLGNLPRSSDERYLLICTTDLTHGDLQVIGEHSYQEGSKALLVEALLAGSAFPGVFRPRRQSEVYPDKPSTGLYVDGGIMDNLPLDPIVQFLNEASKLDPPLLARQPESPHLILTASLERRVGDISDTTKLRRFNEDWLDLTKRVTELQYNRKITAFTNAQRHFRFIYNCLRDQGVTVPPEVVPLKLVVGTVKPEWLCGTFGFHPMLGFSQIKQAASIAHGCAMTLATLSQLANGADGKAWGIDMGPIESDACFEEVPLRKVEKDEFIKEQRKGERVINAEYLEKLSTSTPTKKSRGGICWFRKEAICPFSAQGLDDSGGHFPKETQSALMMIYDLCGRASTHKQEKTPSKRGQ